eukprot:scaffold237038_cov22-Tisochrysis_lutea.AAC.2
MADSLQAEAWQTPVLPQCHAPPQRLLCPYVMPRIQAPPQILLCPYVMPQSHALPQCHALR